MDMKKSFLSGMKEKLNLGGKEKWDTSRDPFEGQELDEDMAVLSLEDSPAKHEEDVRKSFPDVPEEAEEDFLKELSSAAGKPELTLTPDLTEEPKGEGEIVKPELTLDPGPISFDEPDPDFQDVGGSGLPEEEPEVPEKKPEATEDQPETAGEAAEDDGDDRWDMPDQPPKKDRWSWFRQKRDPGEEWEERITETEEEMAEAFRQEPPAKPGPEEAPGEEIRTPYNPEEDEDLEPDMDQGGNRGKIFRESAGRMASGVGAGLLSVLQFLWGFISEAAVTFASMFWDHLKNEMQPRNWKHVISRYLLTLIIIYYEIVLKLSTAKDPKGFALLYIVLFSFCWGLLGYLLTTFLKPRNNRNARKILIPLCALPFIVSYFRYQRMGKFYGLNDTVPVTSNFTAMLRLIFSAQGILHILLFLLPAILYALLLYHFDAARRIRAKRRIRTIVTILVLWFVTWLLVLANGNYRWAYSKEYTYHSAVCDFGLLSAMRLDVRARIIGDGNKTARTPASVAPAAEETAIQAESLPPESPAESAEENVPETTAVPVEDDAPQAANAS